MDVEFKLDGFKELDNLLDKLDDRAAKNVANSAVRAGANIIKKDAQRRVPVFSGRLKKSITVKKDTKAFRKFGSILFQVGANLKASRGTVAPHAHLVEFGTSAHPVTVGVFRKKQTGKKVLSDGKTVYGKEVMVRMRPQPFLRPAVDYNAEKVFQTIGQRLGKGIIREAKKLGKFR